MAKPIIPLETGTKAIGPVPGGMRGSGPLNGSAREWIGYNVLDSPMRDE